jgi:hypothetical protein
MLAKATVCGGELANVESAGKDRNGRGISITSSISGMARAPGNSTAAALFTHGLTNVALKLRFSAKPVFCPVIVSRIGLRVQS